MAAAYFFQRKLIGASTTMDDQRKFALVLRRSTTGRACTYLAAAPRDMQYQIAAHLQRSYSLDDAQKLWSIAFVLPHGITPEIQRLEIASFCIPELRRRYMDDLVSNNLGAAPCRDAAIVKKCVYLYKKHHKRRPNYSFCSLHDIFRDLYVTNEEFEYVRPWPKKRLPTPPSNCNGHPQGRVAEPTSQQYKFAIVSGHVEVLPRKLQSRIAQYEDPQVTFIDLIRLLNVTVQENKYKIHDYIIESATSAGYQHIARTVKSGAW